MSDWFKIIIGDYVLAPVISAGMLEAIEEVDLRVGFILGFIFGIGDTLIYLKKSYNLATKVLDRISQ